MFCNVHLFEMLHVYIACNYSNSFLFCGNQFCGCCCLNRAAMAYQMIKTRLQLCLWRSTQDVRRTCRNKFIIYIFLLSFIKPQQNYRFIIIHIYEWIDKMDRRTDPPFGSGIPFTHHISYNPMVFAGCLYKSIWMIALVLQLSSKLFNENNYKLCVLAVWNNCWVSVVLCRLGCVNAIKLTSFNRHK